MRFYGCRSAARESQTKAELVQMSSARKDTARRLGEPGLASPLEKQPARGGATQETRTRSIPAVRMFQQKLKSI